METSLLVRPAFVIALAALSAAVGVLSLRHTRLAELLAAVVLAGGILLGNAARIAVIALLAVWITKRAPGINVSYADILAATAGSIGLIVGAGRLIRREGQIVINSFVVYLGSLSITLVYNPSFRSDLEWLHRIGLVVGSLLAGALIVQGGLRHLALRALLGVSIVMSVAGLISALSSGFSPATPFGYQKNFFGSMTATVLVVVIAAHKEFRLPRLVIQLAGTILILGLLASQSRGAMVAAALGGLIWWFRSSSRSSPRLRLVAIAGALALASYAAYTVNSELKSKDVHTSITQRFQVERATRHLWEKHPLTGVGLRFFKTPRYAGYQPPNDVLNEILAEAGVFGLAGFVIFVGGSLIGLGRGRGDLATAGLCVVAGRFAHGLFDIYWTAGTTGLTWIVAGMGLAAQPPRADV